MKFLFALLFLRRVEILSDIPVSEVNDIVSDIPLNSNIVEFIKENRERCYVVTGNLDVWISRLIEKNWNRKSLLLFQSRSGKQSYFKGYKCC